MPSLGSSESHQRPSNSSGWGALFGASRHGRNDYPLSSLFRRGAHSSSSSGGGSSSQGVSRDHRRMSKPLPQVPLSPQGNSPQEGRPHPFETRSFSERYPSLSHPPSMHGRRHDSGSSNGESGPTPTVVVQDDDSPISPAGSSSATSSTAETGYELCPKCIESAGVIHAETALSTSLTTSSVNLASSAGSSGNLSTGYSPPSWPSQNDVNGQGPNVSPLLGRRPKRKGQIRHAYAEKVWGVGGWTDVGEFVRLCCVSSTLNIFRPRIDRAG